MNHRPLTHLLGGLLAIGLAASQASAQSPLLKASLQSLQVPVPMPNTGAAATRFGGAATGQIRQQLRTQVQQQFQQRVVPMIQQQLQQQPQPVQQQPYAVQPQYQQTQPQYQQQTRPRYQQQTRPLYQQPFQQQLISPHAQPRAVVPTPAVVPTRAGAAVISNSSLREIDRLVVLLDGYAKSLHDEYHHHLEGERHAAKLDEDVTTLEQMAEGLHAFAVNADNTPQSIARLRADTNSLIQMAVRIARTIDLTEPWLRQQGSHVGLDHMRQAARNALSTALQIDAYLPVDTLVIDTQAEMLEAAVKELHDEFHEHLEHYEVSAHLDEDLEEVETLVEHMHQLAHNKSWQQVNFNHLLQDIGQVKQKTAHIESLFVRQAQIGVRQRDWIGIEHSRDAITDVLSSAYLLEHMVRKTSPQPHAHPVQPIQNARPKRDRHGHPIRN